MVCRIGPDLQRRPTGVAQRGQRVHIRLVNGCSIGEGLHRLVNGGLAQQVQGGVRGAVGVVGDVVCLGARELVVGVKAGQLDVAHQAQIVQQIVGLGQKIVEIQKVGEGIGRY